MKSAMVHVITTHFKDDRWVDIQLAYLRDNLSEPFRIYAYLTDIPEKHRGKYFYYATDPMNGLGPKLNFLADVATRHADSLDDLLMFIDGDAFPIGDILAFGRSRFDRFPLVAVQRRENNGDIQPHNSFCLTTIGVWNTICGDWKAGGTWLNAQGQLVTDVGGNLLHILADKRIEWYPMLRSNEIDLHPLWFGIYENLIYHHGAGFRPPVSRTDIAGLDPIRRYLTLGIHTLPRNNFVGRMRRKLLKVLHKDIAAESDLMSKAVFARIQKDPYFYRYFMQEERRPVVKAGAEKSKSPEAPQELQR